MSKDTSAEGVKATRMELLALKERLVLAEKGHDLLQEKLEALTNELFSSLSFYRKSRKNAIDVLEEARSSFCDAKMIMGSQETQNISLGTKRTIYVSTRSKNLMGISVPQIQIHQNESELGYTLYGTSIKLDDCIKTIENAVKILIKLSEIQATISRLAKEISNTRRRVNALKFIVIPHLQNSVARIRLILAEREREEFTRLKKIKKRLEAES